MDPLALTSAVAADLMNQRLAVLQSAITAAAGNPTPESLSAQSQAEVQVQFSTAALQKSLEVERSQGSQLAQMMAQGSGVDIYG